MNGSHGNHGTESGGPSEPQKSYSDLSATRMKASNSSSGRDRVRLSAESSSSSNSSKSHLQPGPAPSSSPLPSSSIDSSRSVRSEHPCSNKYTGARSGGVCGTTDLDVWIGGFSRNPPALLTEGDLWSVCQKIKELLVEESNVQPVPAPVVVCGDIHGQLEDLLLLLQLGGSVSSTRYIFLGDYVDRGRNSVETFQLLMLLKLRYPGQVTLLRGNHETRQVTSVYGFYDECLRKYGNANVWRFCCEVFDYLALSATIDGAIHCVHGGLSPDLHLLDQLRLIHRVREIPTEGAFGDLVWSDPAEVSDWQTNPRGAGWLYGHDAVQRFRHLNGIELIARAHQLAMDGFKYSFDDCSVLTVWSAPNYCYRCGNVAAVLRLDDQLQRQLLVFRHSTSSHTQEPGKHQVPYFL
ncbi:serine threonine protein [Cyclospora cayetanensis]|uniref:Serine/threonine-protein phosphatase n=1 Tax=Cyclospora cayetanensis TaxID=88456 RepID=A0A1D3CZ57_9EIME|nr:serine threonine protein [Cyclospora cayetanensis]